jgi:hypothetical protein
MGSRTRHHRCIHAFHHVALPPAAIQDSAELPLSRHSGRSLAAIKKTHPFDHVMVAQNPGLFFTLTFCLR